MEPYAGIDVTRLLQVGMQTAAMNHRLIANNIANAETPHYNAVSMDFQKTLQSVLDGQGRLPLRRTQAGHIDKVVETPSVEKGATLGKNDGNKVDLDLEMARLAENTGRYTLYSSLLTKRFQVMKNMLNNIR